MKKLCLKCGKEITPNNYERHIKACDGKVHEHQYLEHEGLNCKYCGKVCKNKDSLAQHEIRCKKNSGRLVVKSNLGYYNQKGREAWNKGLTKETDSRIKKGVFTRTENKKLGKHKDTSGENNSMKKHPEARFKISQTCLKRSKEGTWHTSLARNNHYIYKGEDMHCKWEVAYAKWLDSQNIKWERNKNRFEYLYQNKKHYYTPDFYLVETQEYVEIKGYPTGKDYAKWRQFPSKLTLVVLREKELKSLGII